MQNFIPYGKQTIEKDDLNSVLKSLKQKLLTTGPKVIKFEKEFNKKVKSKFSVSSNSGTSAIFLALKAIRLKPKEVVIIPSINFIAAANVSKMIGAKIFFADVDSRTGQMSPENLIECIKINKLKKIKVIFTMHNGGFNNFAKEFYSIKKKYRCFLIEDACHALGANNSSKKDDKVGNCRYSDLATFSFHPLKSITTGEGGMTTTRNKLLYKEMLKLRNHGFDVRKNSKNKNYNWKNILLSNSLNFRLNDIQSSLGISQIKKLDKFVKKRNYIANYYLKKLSHLSNFIFLPNNNKFYSAWHLFIIIFKTEKISISRDKIIQLLFKSGILTQVHYIPNYRQKPFLIKSKKNFKGAEYFFSRCLSLPIYPEMSKKQLNYVIKRIENIIFKNKKIPNK